MSRIYLDNSATTRVLPEVIEEMSLAWAEFGNPSSVHQEGQRARKRLEEGREAVARILGISSDELFFTSGGTESNNWALRSFYALGKKGRCIKESKLAFSETIRDRIIVSAIEHPSILETCKALEREGAKITYLPVDQYGLVAPDTLRKALADDTALVSIMLANNEIGTIEPIFELADIAHEKGAFFHTDAVQAVGSIPVHVQDLNVDALSFSAHKFGGPTGVGGLFVRSGIKLDPLIYGGGQEYGRRSGTENLTGILGMAKALEIVTSDLDKKQAELSSIRDALITEVLAEIPGTKLCGHPTQRLPGNAHFVFEGIDGEALLLYLNLQGYACSSGSACTSGKNVGSHVLLAIGLSENESKSALRISIGRENTKEEVLSIVPLLKKTVSDLRNR